MKKLLLIIAIVIGIAGCTNASVKISNPKSLVASIGNVNITRNQLFNLMMSQDPAGTVLAMAKKIVVEAKVPINDEIKAEARELLDFYKTPFSDDSDFTFEDFLKQMNMFSEEEFIERLLVPMAQEKKLVNMFLTENIEKYVATHFPRKVRIIETKELADAEAAIAEVRAGGNFETIAKKYSTSTTYAGQLLLLHKDSKPDFVSAVPTVIKTFLLATLSPTLTQTPLLNESAKVYYVVQVIETDIEKFEDEFIEEMAKVWTVVDEMFMAYFKEGNFQIYDITIYEQMAADYFQFLPKK